MPSRPSAAPTPRRPVGGKQARAERTRELVIDTTVECINAEGFAAASTQRIVENAHVTWGVIQYHFGGRDGLLMAVVDKGVDNLQRTLAQLPESADSPDVRTRTDAIVTAAWDAFSDPTSMASMEILIGTRSRRDRTTAQHIVEIANTLTDLSARIGDNLDASCTTAVADLLWSALRGMVFAQMVVRAPIDTSRERHTLTEMLSTYILHRTGEC